MQRKQQLAPAKVHEDTCPGEQLSFSTRCENVT